MLLGKRKGNSLATLTAFTPYLKRWPVFRLVMLFAPYNVPALIEEINNASHDLGKETGDARQRCLDAARSLCFALETPVESILRNTWAEVGPIQPSCTLSH